MSEPETRARDGFRLRYRSRALQQRRDGFGEHPIAPGIRMDEVRLGIGIAQDAGQGLALERQVQFCGDLCVQWVCAQAEQFRRRHADEHTLNTLGLGQANEFADIGFGFRLRPFLQYIVATYAQQQQVRIELPQGLRQLQECVSRGIAWSGDIDDLAVNQPGQYLRIGVGRSGGSGARRQAVSKGQNSGIRGQARKLRTGIFLATCAEQQRKSEEGEETGRELPSGPPASAPLSRTQGIAYEADEACEVSCGTFRCGMSGFLGI